MRRGKLGMLLRACRYEEGDGRELEVRAAQVLNAATVEPDTRWTGTETERVQEQRCKLRTQQSPTFRRVEMARGG